jgi:hypothetical protein
LAYSLNTLVAESEIKEGLEVTELSEDFNIEPNKYYELLALIDKANRQGVYWELPDEIYNT